MASADGAVSAPDSGSTPTTKPAIADVRSAIVATSFPCTQRAAAAKPRNKAMAQTAAARPRNSAAFETPRTDRNRILMSPPRERVSRSLGGDYTKRGLTGD
jgi:hypothetical protein